jgi:hypothetical protein
LAEAQGSGDLAEALGAVIRTSPQPSLSLIKRDRVTRGAQQKRFASADGVGCGMRARGWLASVHIGAGHMADGAR